ncbi:hypothetical protein OUZ56_024871 [Daphnia magna]|uniref:Uncharacterized protein n=1 Tax=Daphnia magna TaxID=35525 RepID=A0ABQ9ZI80_9CRUS|nr:hypothetical protein OUZ56_024871 [Daphnia magna]
MELTGSKNLESTKLSSSVNCVTAAISAFHVPQQESASKPHVSMRHTPKNSRKQVRRGRMQDIHDGSLDA